MKRLHIEIHLEDEDYDKLDRESLKSSDNTVGFEDRLKLMLRTYFDRKDMEVPINVNQV